MREWAQTNRRVALLYKGSVLDATHFAGMHPGGEGLILKYGGQDISDVFHSPAQHRHDHLSLQLLLSLEVGRIDDAPLARQGFLSPEEPLMHQV